MKHLSILPYGDQAVLINFEQKIDPEINGQVLRLKEQIEKCGIQGITFSIPAYCSLTIGYDPTLLEYQVLEKIVRQLVRQTLVSDPMLSENTDRTLKIPVCYEAPFALDIEELSKQKDMTPQQIINYHTGVSYRVYMLGFLPGFVFMGKLPEQLKCRRRNTPRLRVPKGSVGMAGFQTGIYPSVSPGGWQIIGRTPVDIFDPKASDPFVFSPGDTVVFHSVSKSEFSSVRSEVETGTFNVQSLIQQ